jgi:hypothetical protein
MLRGEEAGDMTPRGHRDHLEAIGWLRRRLEPLTPLEASRATLWLSLQPDDVVDRCVPRWRAAFGDDWRRALADLAAHLAREGRRPGSGAG